ncbi:hypothetical protein IMCC3317_17780 [Kordia antarctica]|uniref:MotA/TolQ/ExbB proton channel domain-containing protein n=1 Tax=Kordia antarctica TaxID=1218801 RepID=A0A7L4ZII3_9FLAO|nr:MotA/TolQ/ExbB proton channel family protein [Kordia antarctica]QHI36415.1 hypothetical protein IMCC3317_17780 [Kordia antarctica]
MKIIEILKRNVRLIKKVSLSLLIGWFIYGALVWASFENLESAIEEATFKEYLFDGDPALKGVLLTGNNQNDYFNSVSEMKLTWRILQNIGVLSKDKSFANFENDNVFKKASSTICSVFNDKNQDSGITTLLELNKDFGNTPANPLLKNNDNEVKKALIKSLARSPGSFEKYVQLLEDARKDVNNDAKLNPTNIFIYSFPKDLFPSLWGRNTSLEETTSIMFNHTDIKNKYESISDGKSLEQYQQIKDFYSKLLIAISNDSNVSKARDWVMVFNGIMQLIMIIVFTFCLNIILTYKPENNSKYKYALIYSWGEDSLPIFGFIGTILGLMKALGDAYKIPLANGSVNAALSISDITNALSIAFTTTLMAFVLGMILSLFKMFNPFLIKNTKLLKDE